jgi:hypothetical protein
MALQYTSRYSTEQQKGDEYYIFCPNTRSYTYIKFLLVLICDGRTIRGPDSPVYFVFNIVWL